MSEGFKERHKDDFAVASFWVGVVGTFVSLGGIGWAVFSAKPDGRFWYIAISSSVYIVALFALLVYMAWNSRQDVRKIEQVIAQVQSVRAEKEVLQGNLTSAMDQLHRLERSYPDIHQIAHDFRDEMARLRTEDHMVDKAFFIKALDTLKLLFDGITGKPCSLCIKVFVDENRTLKTLCRDSRSAPTRGTRDDSTGHHVDANTDFNLMMKDIRRWWFSNDLAQENNYLNENPKYLECYKSTIVVPIKWNGPEDVKYYQGFLCVDSPVPGTFSEDYEPYLLSAVGDMLQPLLEIYRLNQLKVQAASTANS